MVLGHIFVLILVTAVVQGQLNGVKPLLVPCYNVSAIPGILIANNRPPANLNIFLEILRRLEDSNPSVSVREFAALIVERLRQNGITISTGRTTDLSFGIPYAPQGLEAIKGTFILQYFPDMQQTLNFGDLQYTDICSFHYMISNSNNKTVRGDESTTCSRSARYQSRARRAAPNRLRRETEPNDTTEKDIEQVEGMGTRRLANSAAEDSTCPIELGVIYTNHGAVKIGTVLTALGAAYNQQNDRGVDNRYAASLAGDIAHAALIDLTYLNVGPSGGFNSTINPKYFFLERNVDLELTDQDIRGSIDGLLMALKLDNSIRSRYSDVKLSQIIDMYYSPMQRGVFDPTFRACNRKSLYSQNVDFNTLITQVRAYMSPLDEFGTYPITITSPDSYDMLTASAVDKFVTYLDKIKDLDCPQIDSAIESVATDLLIFIDPNWSYATIQPILSYILDSVDVSKYASRYTLFSGADGQNLTNSTNYLLDFHKNYNLSVHDSLPKQFDYIKIYEALENTTKFKLNNRTYSGGESTVVLLVARSPPNNDQRGFLEQRRDIIKQWLPDVNIHVLGLGSSQDYSSVLLNPTRDFTSLTERTNDDDLKTLAKEVLDRIRPIPRSIINPSCGSEFKQDSVSSFTMTEYVDLYSINYYKISPNYFITGDGSRTLKITEVSTGSITICTSREESRPNNQSSECRSLQSSVHTIELNGLCSGSVSECSPLYISVYGNTTQYRCRDYRCRFPDSLKFTISLDNVGCASGAFKILGNFILLILLFILVKL